MALLAPLWLGLVALAGVPVLLHLWRRRVGVRVDFPALRYLLGAEAEANRDRRTRNLLLLVLRVIAIAAAALAAARPAWRSGGAPDAVAVVLDNSLSTGLRTGETRTVDTLRRTAAAALQAAGPSARRWLVTADGVARAVGSRDVAAITARVPLLAGTGTLAGAVREAARLVRGSSADGAVLLLTDAQATAWPDSAIAMEGVRLLVATAGANPGGNGAVVDARAVPERWTPRGTLTATLRSVTRGRRWTVLAGPDILAQGAATGDSAQVLTVPLAPRDTGWQALRIALTPDALPGDDTAHVAVHVGAMPRVRGDGSPFVEAALNTLVETGRIERGDGLRVAPAEAEAPLPAILLPPRDAGGLAAANAALARRGIPVRFGAPVEGNAPVRLVAPLAFRGDTGVRATRWYPLLGATAAGTLARVGTAAVAVRGDRWLVLGVPLDGAGSTLPLRASFLPWLGAAVGDVMLGTAPTMEVAAGAPLVPPADADGFAPLGARPVAGAPLPTRAPANSGVWGWWRGARMLGVLRVTPPERESDLRRLDAAALARVLPGAEIVRSLPAAPAALARGNAPRSLVLPFVLLSLLALVAEAIVSRTGALRLRPGSTPVARAR